jgi:hypothetical protein
MTPLLHSSTPSSFKIQAIWHDISSSNTLMIFSFTNTASSSSATHERLGKRHLVRFIDKRTPIKPTISGRAQSEAVPAANCTAQSFKGIPDYHIFICFG